MEGIFVDGGRRWVEKAIEFYEAAGKNIALAELSDPRGPFVEGEHYVYVLDISGVMLAHPINKEYIGKDFCRVQDADGKNFIQDIVDTANAKPCGWVSYKWFDPATKTEQNKIAYFERSDSMIFCSGVCGGNRMFGPTNGRQPKVSSMKPAWKASLRSLIQRVLSILTSA